MDSLDRESVGAKKRREREKQNEEARFEKGVGKFLNNNFWSESKITQSQTICGRKNG